MQPLRERVKNVIALSTMATASLQMLAPIALLNGYIEDQWTAMVMMLLNVISCYIGMGRDFMGSIVPFVEIVKTTSTNTYLSLHAAIVGFLIAAKKIKKVVKSVRVAPPPPVWTIIKTPPPVLMLMDKVMTEETMNYVSDVGGQAKKMILSYTEVFAKYAKRWVQNAGREELDKQFQSVMAGKKKAVDITKFVKQFHRKACIRAFRETQPTLKDIAQKLYDAATKEAKIVAETRRNIKSGSDPIAAANSVVNPELIKKITDLMGPFGPTIADVGKKAIEGQIKWLKEKGQAKIDQKMKELNDIADGNASEAAKDEKIPPIALKLSTNFNKIANLEEFRKQFAADLAAAIGLPADAASRIAIKDVVAGSTKVSFTFTPGEPVPKELLKGVMDLFKKSPKKLPGMLKDLMPEIPALPTGLKEEKSGLDAAVAQIMDGGIIDRLKKEMAPVYGFIKAYEKAAAQAKEDWREDGREILAENGKAVGPDGKPGKKLTKKQRAVLEDTPLSRSEIKDLDKLGVMMPSGEFQKAGLIAVIGELQPMMDVLAKEEVNKVMDDAMQAKVDSYLALAAPIVEQYKAQAEATQQKWLEWGGGQEKIDAAGSNAKKLAKVEVPIASFQKAGLEVGLSLVQTQLEAMAASADVHKDLAERARAIMREVAGTKGEVEGSKKAKKKAAKMAAKAPKSAIAARSTDMRRGMSQLLQELVVAKVREEVFPELGQHVVALGLPTVELIQLVSKQAQDSTEEGLRKQVHGQLVAAFRELGLQLAVGGATPAPEPGAAQVARGESVIK
jgi:hypothetical protein